MDWNMKEILELKIPICDIKGLSDIREEIFINSFSTIINSIRLYDNKLMSHCETVAELSKNIAIELGCKNYEVECAYITGLLHDVGKVFINEDILGKKSALSDYEYAIVKRHSKYGQEIISEDKKMENIGKYILHHHEKFDGTGYPNRLRGFEIPYISRIVSVADAYVAMTQDRPYKSKVSMKEAIIEINKCSRSQFDPYVVDGFLSIMDADRKYLISRSIL